LKKITAGEWMDRRNDKIFLQALEEGVISRKDLLSDAALRIWFWLQGFPEARVGGMGLRKASLYIWRILESAVREGT